MSFLFRSIDDEMIFVNKTYMICTHNNTYIEWDLWRLQFHCLLLGPVIMTSRNTNIIDLQRAEIKCSLPPPRRLCFHQRRLVCKLARLCKNNSQNSVKRWQSPRKKTFWWYSGSRYARISVRVELWLWLGGAERYWVTLGTFYTATV